jgi:ubiquinone/menaquinone biosynthesis C-methylase UbiE
VLGLADRLHIGSEQRVRREVFAGLYLPASAFVVDVGCGTGANSEFLPGDISYVGVDLSANMLRLSKARCVEQSRNPILIQADASTLPLRKDLSPLVIAMGVLQHLTEPQKALAQMHRVASRGAQLLIIDERHAAARILPADEPARARRIGEYFVMSSRKD